MDRQILSLLGSRIKAMEVILAKEGAKKVIRMLCHEMKVLPTREYLRSQGLSVELSDFKVLKDPVQGIYADRSIKVPKEDPRRGYLILYASHHPMGSQRAKELESEGDHRGLGEVLGYPECCCDFFEKHFGEHHTDLTLDTLRNSKGFKFPFEMNIAARHFDSALLSHFPCSFQCEESLGMARKNLDTLKEKAPDIASFMLVLLKSSILYTDQGILLFEGATIKEDVLEFEEVQATQRLKLFHFLEKEGKLRIVDKENIMIAGEPIEGGEMGIMVFG
ncbi:MAG TPA: hypothetical protein VJB12_01400 [Candidatus Nanoarchaeia archaeon]|nr:hypothetical protein [Candidatus Nanoarchaeia archaeon]